MLTSYEIKELPTGTNLCLTSISKTENYLGYINGNLLEIEDKGSNNMENNIYIYSRNVDLRKMKSYLLKDQEINSSEKN